MDDLTCHQPSIDVYYSGDKGYQIDCQLVDICCAFDIIIMKAITIEPIGLHLTLLLLFLEFIGPVSSQLLSGNFSPEYVQLLKETRKHHEWWKTCRRTTQEMREDVCYQYFFKPIEENSTELASPKTQLEESSQEADNKQEFNLLDVATIIGEEIYKVALQTWSDVVEYLSNSQQEVISVQYDDNFASLYGGAIILRKSSCKIHNAHAILEDNSEKYLFSDQKLPIEIIIALKEEVKIQWISIKSNEIYSSTVKSFILEGALDQSEDEDQQGEGGIWYKLLSAQAKNSGMEQKFRTKNKAVRFLRLRILSQYGDWKYFTMTQLKVYGSGLFTEALIDYQTVQNNTSDALVNEAQLELANDLSLIYKQLNNNFGEEQQKKPDENVLTFLLEKVNILSKIHQFHIFYMNNMSQRLENITKVQKDFKEHKNQYQAKNSFEEKYRQHRKVQQKIAQLQQNFRRQAKKYNQFIQQFKYSDTPATEQCPNKEEEVRTMLIYAVCIAVVLNAIITALVGYCYFRYFRGKQQKK